MFCAPIEKVVAVSGTARSVTSAANADIAVTVANTNPAVTVNNFLFISLSPFL